MILKLRIKKQYFDEIRKGIKDIEYRADSVFYRKRLNRPYSQIELNFGTQKKLKAKIDKIERVINPLPEDERPSFLNTEFVFAIYLSPPFVVKR